MSADNFQPPDPPEPDYDAMAEAWLLEKERHGYLVLTRAEFDERLDSHATDAYAEGRKDEAEAHAPLRAVVEDLVEALKSAEYAVKVTRACLMDSVETHGTHGGWLHTEAQRLDSELDLMRAAIAKALGDQQ